MNSIPWDESLLQFSDISYCMSRAGRMKMHVFLYAQCLFTNRMLSALYSSSFMSIVLYACITIITKSTKVQTLSAVPAHPLVPVRRLVPVERHTHTYTQHWGLRDVGWLHQSIWARGSLAGSRQGRDSKMEITSSIYILYYRLHNHTMNSTTLILCEYVDIMLWYIYM